MPVGRRTFHEQLAEVEFLCVEMSGLVLEQLERAVSALAKRDEDLAREVVAHDDPIDEHYIEIERRILELMDTQAPVASDLRLISAIIHVNIHLERMGDLCTNIAKFVVLIKDFPDSDSLIPELKEMAGIAARMIETAMHAFTRRDLDLALSLPELDQPLNRLNRGMIRSVADYAGDEEMLEWTYRMILVSRYLERLGDHAVDIGEQVGFLITGEYREFTDASHKGDF